MDFSRQLFRLYKAHKQQSSFDPMITVQLSFERIQYIFGDADRHTATPNKPNHFSYDLELKVPFLNIHSSFIRIFDWTQENPELIARNDPTALVDWHIVASNDTGITQVMALLESLGHKNIVIHPNFPQNISKEKRSFS